MFSKKYNSMAFAALLFANSVTMHAVVVQAQECQQVNTVSDFDLEQYASATWYVHQQAENAYSPLDQNFCVRAEYDVRTGPTSLWGYTVDVHNQARDDTGRDIDAFLCAYQDDDDENDPTSSSKLNVAPCFLPKRFAGPYWVVAYDETQGYALISGGQPTIPNPDGGVANGCRTGTGINDSGLWIFTRSPTRDEALISTVRGIAQDAGFDLSVLNDVDQQGCYDDEQADELACQDEEGSPISTWFGSRDCAWVANYAWYRCWFYSEYCPETCGECE